MIRVACPQCGRTFRTMTEGMGKTAICSGCHQPFRIGAARPKFAWKSDSLAEESWVGVEAPQEKREIKHCIICQAPLDDDAIRCMACGANQITGIVHKSRPQPTEPTESSIWAIVPWRLLAVVVLLAVLAGGAFYGVRNLFTSVADEGVELARVRLIKAAAMQVAGGLDPDAFAAKFAGQVKDDNLPRFLDMLQAGDAAIRAAAAPLIACGRVTQVGPIVAKARVANQELARGAIGVLQAIGPRRLVELSGHADEPVRRSAAEALCCMYGIKAEQATLDSLAEQTPSDEKVERLNELCRLWPRAIGEFTIKAGDETAPINASIQQIGRTFYLQIGMHTFTSRFDAERSFVISVERWCAATGVAVDAKKVSDWVTGTVKLNSPFGVGWQGEASVRANQDLDTPPPGFLPVGKLRRGESATLQISLDN